MTHPHVEEQAGALAAAPSDAPHALRAQPLEPWLYAIGLTALAFAVRLAIDPLLGAQLPYVSFFVAVTVTAYLATPSATVLAIVLGFIAATWFFAPPRYATAPGVPSDAVGALSYFVVCGFIAGLGHRASAARARAVASAAELARRHEELEAEVAQHRRTETALEESEARFRHLAEAVPQIVYDLRSDGRAGYFNGRWSAYTGRPATVADRFDVVHPDDRSRMRRAWARARRARAPYECEFRLRRHDGEYRWFLARALPVPDERGEVVRWFGTTTDIHDVKLAHEALREADRRKNEFLATLSHELRNPLSPIKNGLFILRRAPPGGDQARRAQDVIARQVAQLSRLVDDLLDVTRITQNKLQLQRERVELNALVHAALEDYRAQFEERGVRLELAPAPAPVLVDGDPSRLAQVVGNLLHNAAKFTDRGGSARVELSTHPEARRALLRVVDTGAGLAPETLRNLFEPFMQASTTLDRSKGGLGLGLALVKRLVELHGGEVDARSAGLGQGAEFLVRLPLAPEEPARAPAPRPGLLTSPRRVLIIEDNLDAAVSLREVLEIVGHRVDVVHSGPDGIARARALRPDVVLCDIGLPGMNGFDVARALRSDPALDGALLVAVSGYALPEDVRRAREAGFALHVSKPPGVEELRRVLAEAPRRDPPSPAPAEA